LFLPTESLSLIGETDKGLSQIVSYKNIFLSSLSELIFRKVKVGILRSDQCWAKFDLTQIQGSTGCLEGKLRGVPRAC